MGVLAKGAEILQRCVSRHFAAGPDHKTGTSLPMAFPNRREDHVRLAIPEDGDRVQITQEHLVRAHLLAGFR